jgi:hypothetical protein
MTEEAVHCLKAFLRGGGKGVQLAVSFLLSPGGVLEALLYPLREKLSLVTGVDRLW